MAVQQLGVSRRLDETRVVAALTRVLNQDAFYGVRATAAKSLGSIGSETAKSGLLAALNQPDSRVRTAVVEALGHFSQEPAVYRAVVHAVQHDESYAVGGAAAEALGSSGIPEVFEVLQRIVISNPEVHLTQAALRGLAATHDARALSILLAAAQPGQPERVRVQALTELAQFPADLDAKQTLELAERVGAALGDPFAQLRQAAVMLAGRLKFAQFCSQIQTAAENAPIPEYQQAAENVSRQLQCPGPGSLNRSSD